MLRGVVQLFNAVRKHQKTIDTKVKEVGGSERKKAKLLSSVSKKDFIDVLRRTDGGSGSAVKAEKEAVSPRVPYESYMLGLGIVRILDIWLHFWFCLSSSVYIGS